MRERAKHNVKRGRGNVTMRKRAYAREPSTVHEKEG